MEKKLIEVESRYSGMVSITEAGTSITRRWPSEGHKLFLSEESITNLIMAPGGRYILENYLIVKSEEVLEKQEIEAEPEYSYTRKDVANLLLNGSREEVIDMINFAPEGLKDLILKTAIEVELPDMNKRNLINEYMMVDISKMIECSKFEDGEEGFQKKEARKKERLAGKTTTAKNSGRKRTATAKA